MVGRGIETPREDAGQADAGLATGRDHLVDAGGCDLERLFADDVLAGPRGRDRRFEMSTAWRADGDDIEAVVLQEGVEIAVGRAAELPGHLGCGIGAARVDRNEFRIRHGGDRSGVKAGDHARTNDTKSHCCS